MHDHEGLWCTVPEQKAAPRTRLSDELLADPDRRCPARLWTEDRPGSKVQSQKDDPAAGPGTLDVGLWTRCVPWCLFGRPAGCCGKKFECRRSGDLVQVVDREQCSADCPQAQPRLAIGAVVCAWNESEVRRTVESLADSIVSDRTDLTIIVVDDGSSDGSCQFSGSVVQWSDGSVGKAVAFHSAPVRRAQGGLRAPHSALVVVVRHDKPWGLGRSRNHGWQVARELGCDAVSFHDAHMLFTPLRDTDCVRAGGLEHLARRALQLDSEGGAFLCAGSSGYSLDKDGAAQPSGNRMTVCDLFWNAEKGLQPKWRYLAKRPPEEWTRSPSLMGAGYLVSRATAERLEAATACPEQGRGGTLWDDTAGRWGFSEEAMGVKCFLLDVPVYFSADVWFRHCYAWSGSGYRQTNPVPKAGREFVRNVTRCTALLFGQEIFDARFRPYCEMLLDKGPVDEIVADLPDTSGNWSARPCDVFWELLGKGARLDGEHPDHAWMDDVTRAGTWNALTVAHAAGKGMRILQWRPGESTVGLRAMFPEAEIRTIELPGHRAKNWYAWCKAHGVALETVKLQGGYATRPLLSTWGKFDLVIVGGELQDACMETARRVLKPGGTILRNESADRFQIADEFRRAEEKLLAPAESKVQSPKGKGRSPKPAPSASLRAGFGLETLDVGLAAPLVTAVLLNWRRPENLPAVLDSLAAQTVPVQAFIWNNSPDPLPADVAGHPVVKLVADSSVNLGCLPRWQLAAQADTEFICTLDDDLALKDSEVLADAVRAFQENVPRVRSVGFWGWEHAEGVDLSGGRGYKDAAHPRAGKEDRWCDLIKGRFVLTARELLRSVPLPPPGWDDPEPIGFRCDDVYVGLCLAAGEWGRHLLPASLAGRWQSLPNRGTGLELQRGHWPRRGRAVDFVRAWLLDGQASPQSAQRPQREEAVA